MDLTQRQQDIIDASIELIAEKGIQQLTIKNLAKKIGMVEAGIYRHFDSKINILYTILKVFRAGKDKAMAQIKKSNLSPLEQLELLFTKRFAQFTKHPAITAVIFSEEIFQNEKQLSEEVYAIMQESQLVIRQVIQSGQEGGQFRTDISAEQISLLITGALRLIVTQWRLSGFGFNLQSEGKKLFTNIEKIISK